MRLIDLAGPDLAVPDAACGLDVRGLTADSREVKPGWVFVALAGSRQDGRTFIGDAVARGAVALVVGETDALPDGIPPAIPVLRSAEPRRALAHMAGRFHGPGPEVIVAVTGTSGKTSVAEFTRQIFMHLGHKAASLGTLGVIKPSGAVHGSLTTPDPVTLARTVAGLRAEGVTHLAMEASSHGLDQFRIDAVRSSYSYRETSPGAYQNILANGPAAAGSVLGELVVESRPITVGAFTNLGRDHMDYHPTVEHYLNAKLRLFRELIAAGEHGTAVVNADGAYAAEAIAAARERTDQIITVGRKGETIRLVDVQREGFKQRLTIEANGRTHSVLLPLVGAYQVENALTAAGIACLFEGFEPVLSALEHLAGVKGRLDIVAEHNGGLVVVDYAHKPDALIAALAALRPFATGRLISVFGCGGDRDRGKRPIMGRISVEGADVTIVTDDNPRSERPEAIRAEIMAAASGAREIGDRAEAIKAAVAMMGPGDVVMIAGKGHEQGQTVGSTVHPFSDHEQALLAIAGAGI